MPDSRLLVDVDPMCILHLRWSFHVVVQFYSDITARLSVTEHAVIFLQDTNPQPKIDLRSLVDAGATGKSSTVLAF